jgi:aminopeptidase
VLSGVRPERQAALARANAPLRKYFSKLKWNVTLFPTQAYAQDADMSLGAFEDYVYGATFPMKTIRSVPGVTSRVNRRA